MRRRLVALLPFVLAVGACSSVPSYDGGPTESEPYAIVQPEEGCKIWAIDAKLSYNRAGQVYVSPGPHKIKVRIDYPVESDLDSGHPFEYQLLDLDVLEGRRYRIFVKNWEKGPPYDDRLEPKVFKIAGYRSKGSRQDER
ncbi:hypothetical protein HY251_18240 [bacterium]|nr:hypothetical protein [bacterium]